MSASESAVAPAIARRPRFIAGVEPAQRHAAEGDVVLRSVDRSLRDYHAVFHQNPVGTNAEITSMLSGKNSRHAKYLTAESRVNAAGELIDRWDQPLFFHQISGTNMEIRSAGPDHIMWNSDDEVLR